MLSQIRRWTRPIARSLLLVWALVTVMMLVVNVASLAQSPAPDPGGTATGTRADVMDAAGKTFVPPAPADADDAQAKADKQKAVGEFGAQSKAEPLALKLADGVGQNRIAINVMWTLLTAYLVMFMQAGFAMVETGFCRAKNAAHVIMTNFMIYPIGMIGFWIAGFAFMFGGYAASTLGGTAAFAAGAKTGLLQQLVGTNGFFLSGSAYDVGVYTLFIFQMVFMDTTATIPTGAMAERWRFAAFMVYGFFVSMIAYPIYGHWVWGGGWLANLGTFYGLGHGAVDFAGSGVVHAVGGCIGLAGAIVVGPRIGKYDKDGKPNAIPGHHLPMALIGTFILAFGWFGFNPGSTLAMSGGGALRAGVVAVNTMLASAGGAFAALFYMKRKFGKYDPSMAANGFLAGLVAITAPCAFVTAWSSVVIGVIAGFLVCVSVFFWEKRGIDDPVGAVSVHGVCGLFGVLAVGIFADGTYGDPWNGVAGPVKGILYGDAKQFVAQLISAVVCIAWAFTTAYVFFKVQSKFMRLRPTAEEEIAGLDLPEMGALAYPDFQQLDATSPGPSRSGGLMLH